MPISSMPGAEAAAKSRKRRAQAVIYALLVGIIGGLIGWINQDSIKEEWRWFAISRPFMQAKILAADGSGRAQPQAPRCLQGMRGRSRQGLLPGADRGCGGIVRDGLAGHGKRPRAGRRAATRGQDRKAVRGRQIPPDLRRMGYLRHVRRLPSPVSATAAGDAAQQPVINVTFDDAQRYVAWLSKMTGKPTGS